MFKELLSWSLLFLDDFILTSHLIPFRISEEFALVSSKNCVLYKVLLSCFHCRFADSRISKTSLLWQVISFHIFAHTRLLNAPWVENLSYSQIQT